MLKKKHRLTTAEFDHFFASGKRIHTPMLTLVHTPHQRFHGAAVVGKKVSKKAVTRNLLRRRVYNALYALKKERALTGVFIVLVKREAQGAPYAALKTVLQDAVGRIGKSR